MKILSPAAKILKLKHRPNQISTARGYDAPKPQVSGEGITLLHSSESSPLFVLQSNALLEYDSQGLD